MIFPFAGLALGFLVGGTLAARRGGKRSDIVQYACVYAIIFGLIGLFALILIERVLA